MSMPLTPPYWRVKKLRITMRRKKKRSKLSTKSKLSIKRKLSPQQIQVCPMIRK
jgi:hypothetical protein